MERRTGRAGTAIRAEHCTRGAGHAAAGSIQGAGEARAHEEAMYTCFKICRIRTVRASDFFFSSLWPVLAPLSLVLVAAKVLLRTSPTQRRAARKLRSAPCLSPPPPRRFVAAGRYQPKHAAGGHSHSRRKNLLAAHLHAALSQDKRPGTCTRAPAVSGASAAREAASSDGSQKGDAASASAAAAAPARPCPQRTRQRSTRRLDPAPRHARHTARAPPVRRLLTASPPLRSVPPAVNVTSLQVVHEPMPCPRPVKRCLAVVPQPARGT